MQKRGGFRSAFWREEENLEGEDESLQKRQKEKEENFIYIIYINHKIYGSKYFSQKSDMVHKNYIS